jgi:glycosyl transferase family 25
MIPVIVISLKRSTERRSLVRASLNGLRIPFRFYDAVDGKTMSSMEIASLSPQPYRGQYGRSLSLGEIGCAASYKAILQNITRNKCEFACVVEDDAKFSEQFRQFLDEKLLQSLPGFDVLRLHNDCRNGTSGFAAAAASLNGFSIYAPVKPRLFTTAQIFTNAGAAKTIQGMYPLRAPIDNLIYRDGHIPKLRLLEVRPAVVTQHDMTSTIGTRGRTRRTIRSVLERQAFIVARNIRSFINFTRAWGVLSLLRLRYYR